MTKFSFDSASLYTTIISAQAQMTDELRRRTGDQDLGVRVIFYGWYNGSPQTWELTLQGKYGANKCEVKGKHLEQCFEEALRRLGFNYQQQSLQLTHEIEGTVVETPEDSYPNPQPETKSLDDEIPF